MLKFVYRRYSKGKIILIILSDKLKHAHELFKKKMGYGFKDTLDVYCQVFNLEDDENDIGVRPLKVVSSEKWFNFSKEEVCLILFAAFIFFIMIAAFQANKWH